MSMFNKVTKTFQWGPHTVTMETGEVARQSTGAVLVNIDDTVVLATVVAKTEAKAGQDFFPLTVDYTEKTYAAGKIPGSFFKREGRPSELETLTCRLIDRPIRPLFPEGFYNEVQVIVHVVSLNPEVQADIAALIATSAALSISGIPFNGPIGAARVGYVNGEYVLNPGQTQLKDSQLDLVVAGTEAAVLMVESEAQQLSEEIMLGAVVYGHEQGNIAIAAINELVRDAGKPAWDWQPPAKDEPLIAKLDGLAKAKLEAAYQIRNKQARTQACRAAYADVMAALKAEGAEFDSVAVEALLFEIEAKIVRGQILAGEPRIDTDHYFSLWDAARREIASHLGHDVHLELEPGRYLVAEAGVLLAEVRATKYQGGQHFSLVDAGFSDLMRPAMYGAFHGMSVIAADDESHPLRATVVAGPLCESGDVFTQGEGGVVYTRELPEARVGDLLVLHDAGAYGASMSSNYNSRPLAAEVLVEGKTHRLIRRRQTIDELLALEDV